MSFYHDKPLISRESFLELIHERTDQRKKKMKEKRQDGLRRITEMKSKSGMHPLNQFSKEIWLKLLNEVNPEDRFNASQVHPDLQNMMEDSRIRDILFPQAIKLILDCLNDNDDDYIIDISKSQLSPFMMLRQVSKSLNAAVDQWFQEKFEDALGPYERDGLHGVAPAPMVFNMNRDTDRINRLIERYSSGENPAKRLFIRAIEVEVDELNRAQNVFHPFKSSVIKLLEMVGDQVLGFRLHVTRLDYYNEIGATLKEYYLLLKECCQLMPDLRRLEVRLETSDDLEGVPRSLLNLLKAHPFPTLSKLERIGWEHEGGGIIFAVPKIIDAIIKANLHVKMLKLNLEGYLLEELNKKNLKALKRLEYFSYLDCAMSSVIIPKILLTNRWPLQSLKLHGLSVFPNLKEMFNSLMKYPTLQKLCVLVGVPDIGRDIPFLKLPNLTRFECRFGGKIDFDLDDVNFFFSLQLLLYAKKLRSICWEDPAQVEERKELKEYLEKYECHEKMIDFRGGMRDLKYSNIWKVFPELQTLDVLVAESCDVTELVHSKRYHRP